jgi:hypothetical protein
MGGGSAFASGADMAREHVTDRDLSGHDENCLAALERFYFGMNTFRLGESWAMGHGAKPKAQTRLTIICHLEVRISYGYIALHGMLPIMT